MILQRLDIKLTYQCNNYCQLCVQGSKRSEQPGFLPYKTVYALLNSKKRSYKEVVFTGGESSLHPDFIRLIQAAKRFGYVVQIQTNGRMFAYTELSLKTALAGADMFSISIHGHTPKLHDSLTRVPGSLKQSTEGIRKLLSLNRVVVTNTVINMHNYCKLVDIVKFILNAGIRQYQISYPHIIGSAVVHWRKLIPRKSLVMPYVIKAIEFGIKNGCIPKIEAIPHCFLDKYGDCISSYNIPKIVVFEQGIERNWSSIEGKITGPQCHICKYFRSCEGPWQEYPQIFGWDEFKPIP